MRENTKVERAVGIEPTVASLAPTPRALLLPAWWVTRESNPVCQRRRIYSPVQSPMLLVTLGARIGGRRRNRTPDDYVTLVFKTSCRPFSGAFHRDRWRRVKGSNLRSANRDYGLASRCITSLPTHRS